VAAYAYRFARVGALVFVLAHVAVPVSAEPPKRKFVEKGLARLAHEEKVSAVAFSPDGTLLATASGREVRLWDTGAWRLVRKIEAHEKKVLCLRFFPNGRRLATGSLDATVRVLDVTTGKQLHLLAKHRAGVYAIDVSHDGKWIASGSADMTALLWRAGDGTHVRELLGADRNPIPKDAVTETDDGERLVYWDQQKTVMRTLAGINNVRFGPDGTMLAITADTHSGVWFVDTEGKRSTTRVVKRDLPCKWIAFLAGGERMAVEYAFPGGGEVVLYELVRPTVRFVNLPIPEAKSSRRNYCTSADGRTVVASTKRGLMFLDVDTRKITKTGGVLAPPEPLRSKHIVQPIALSPNGRLLAGATDSGEVVIRDVTRGEPLSEIPNESINLPLPVLQRVSPPSRSR
jgi:dipeptidyl aminopeptidase/acylaminoacyl peptidase